MKHVLLALVLLVACKSEGGKKSGLQLDKTIGEDAAKVDPACAAKAKELVPYFEELLFAKASHEINFRWSSSIARRCGS